MTAGRFELAEPELMWRFEPPRAHIRDTVDVTLRNDIVGRRRELEFVDRVLRSAAVSPQTLLIEGPVGIGKTTIWSATVAAAVELGMTVLSCRCVESELTLPFTSLSDLLAALPVEMRQSLSAPQRRALGIALLEIDPDGVAPDPRALGSALLALLRAAAAHSPVAVAVDDTPWMDTSSARAVGFAVRRLGGASVSLLLARRTPVSGGGLEVTAGEGTRVHHLPVGPLDVAELAVLVRRRLGHRVGRPDSERIHADAGGNPFYALEISRTRAASDTAAVSRTGRLPDNLRALVGRRVEAQPVEVRRVLLLAAAASRPTRSLLDSVEAGTAGAGLLAALDQQLLLDTGHGLRFAHPLLANAAYWDATGAERRQAHSRLSMAVPEEEERARHAALATSGADAEVAATLESASQAALARGAPEHAAELLEMAVALTPPSDARLRVHRTQAAADARFRAGDGPGALCLLEELVTSMDAGGPRAAVLAHMAKIQYHDESLVSALQLLEEALPQAAGDAELQTSIRRDLGWARASIGDVSSAELHVREAMRLLPASAGPELTASVWSVRSVIGCLAGQGADLELLERAAELQSTRTSIVAFDAVSCRAQVLKWTDRFEESRHLYRQLRSGLVRQGNEGALPFVYFQESELECWAGCWDAAAELAQAGMEMAELTEQRSHLVLCCYVAGLVDAHRGQVGAARTGLERALSLGESATSIQAWVHTGLGFLELSLGNARAACRHLEAFADMPALTGLREPGVFRCIPDLVEARLLLGDIDAARRLARELEDRGRSLDRPYALAAGARSVALVAAADGRPGEATAAIERALQAHQRLQQPFELARTQLVQGTVLRRMKRRAEARASLEAALAAFDRLGARLWAARTRSELVRTGGGTSGASLTPTERCVAELVATGRTNREVASALSISVKTVEVNLTRVYRKLGVRSRTELAADTALRSGEG